MAFDAASIDQIEAAYAAGDASAPLAHGFFADKRGQYEVHFDRSARRRHSQLNKQSRMARQVRRIATDDDALFVRAQPQRDALCAVCQEEFDVDASAGTEVAPVALRGCTGHCFHRACLAAAVKLSGKCPLCSQSV